MITQNRRTSFIKRWRIEWILFFQIKKNVIIKHIESYKPREKCQADIVLLSNYVWDEFKYIFTMVDHFIKYG